MCGHLPFIRSCWCGFCLSGILWPPRVGEAGQHNTRQRVHKSRQARQVSHSTFASMSWSLVRPVSFLSCSRFRLRPRLRCLSLFLFLCPVSVFVLGPVSESTSVTDYFHDSVSVSVAALIYARTDVCLLTLCCSPP